MPSAKPERVFLLDTNSYLRLADTVYPLFEHTFGEPPIVLKTIPAVHDELGRSQRLKSLFFWANDEKFVDDRKSGFLKAGPAQRQSIVDAKDYLQATGWAEGLNVSKTDVFVLAYALILGCLVVGDDKDMRELADLYEIPMIGIIDFLCVLYDEGGATIERIKEIVDVMERRDDVPNQRDFYFKLGELYEKAEMSSAAKDCADR